MRDEILSYISMQDVLDKYSIKNNGKMFSCPFHGEDKRPSAKIYQNSYYCFACNSAGDTIRFVENLFNLSFKDAMRKINLDFGMGLDCSNVDYEKLRKLKNIQTEKKKKKQELTKRYCYLCDVKHDYEKTIEQLRKKINIKNWQNLTEVISYFEMKYYIINEDLKNIDNLLSNRS